jgi:glycosyltransferase involved in cell wall biosynthesis
MKKSLKEKNILYITHSYNNFIKFQVEILAQKFNHVYVLFRHKPFAQIASIFNFKDGKFHSLEYKQDLKNIPSNITVIPTSIWYLPFNWFYKRLGNWHANAVLKILNKENFKFDIVHAHMLWSAGYAAMKVAKKYNVPLVVTGHGQDVYKQPFLDEIRKSGITEVLNASDRIITVSQKNEQIIKELGINKHIDIIPNGFSPDRYKKVDKLKLRKELNLPLDKSIFVTVANLELVKGHKYLIEAIRNIKDNNIFFIFVGGGTLFNELNKMIQDFHLEDIIKMVDFQKHENVVKFQLASDFAILPSLNEGVPTVMFEALACGLPFISTNVGGIPDIAKDFTGILVDPKNSKELEQAIINSLKTNWDKEKIIEYSKNYTWEKICERIERIYEDLC